MLLEEILRCGGYGKEVSPFGHITFYAVYLMTILPAESFHKYYSQLCFLLVINLNKHNPGWDRFFFALLLTAIVNASRANDVSFDQNYHITWGSSHVTSLNEGREIHISMDNVSGLVYQNN